MSDQPLAAVADQKNVNLYFQLWVHHYTVGRGPTTTVVILGLVQY